MNICDIIETIFSEPEDTVVVRDVNELNDHLQVKERKLNIIHLNIRSLQKNYDELVILVNSLAQSEIDIIVLSETFVVAEINYFNLPGYNIFYNNASLNNHDGTVVYLKEYISPSVEITKLAEVTLLRVVFEFNHINHGIVAFYRPPSANVETFLTDFSKYIVDLTKTDVEIWVGDVNIDLLDNSNRSTINYNSIADSHGYISYINKPTREAISSSTCIDHFFVRNLAHKNKINITGFVMNNSITDHYTTLLNLNYNVNFNQNLNRHKTIYKIDYDRLNEQLAVEQWEGVYHCNDPIFATDSLYSIINSHLKRCTYSIHLNKKQTKLKPWITTGIVNSIRTRDKLKRKILRNVNVNEEHIQYYKNYRNALTKLIKQAKYQYYKQKLDNTNNNYKEFWKIINEASGHKQQKKPHFSELNVDGKCIKDNFEIAQRFNNFFINVGTQMANSIRNFELPVTNSLYNNYQSIFIPPITTNDLILLINKLKNNSAPGPDGISPNTLKKIHQFILGPLQHIFNLIIKTGIVPHQLKTSVVTPIYKNGDRKEMTNYRPISQINCFGKVLEMYLKNLLTAYLKKHSILSNKQYGFLRGFSTEDAINALVSGVLDHFNEDKCVIGIFLDLAKAFDTVPHQRLLQKLETIGIRGGALRLFNSYLSERFQRVKINGTLSDPCIVRMGIPQGTVLGPILFLIYINDLYSYSATSDIISYADDTAILYSAKDWDAAKNMAEKELSKIKEWLDGNFLTLNVAKTKFLTFSIFQSRQPNFNKIEVTQTESVEKVKFVKYLGIMVDQHLRWDYHTDYIAKKVRKSTHIFYSLRNILTAKMLRTVYSSIIESIIRYGIIVWGSLLPVNLYGLQIAQNALLRVMLDLDRLSSINSLYVKHEMLNIKSIYYHSLLCWFHRNKTSFQAISHDYETRNKCKGFFTREKFNKYICQRQTFFNGPKHYNSLPSEIKDIKQFRRFSAVLRQYILSHFDDFNR